MVHAIEFREGKAVYRNRWVRTAGFIAEQEAGHADSVRWFEAKPCYIYHVVNAWEEGDEIIMDACRVVESRPESSPGDSKQARMLAFLQLDARRWRWRFNLKTGDVKEEQLDDMNTEFPTMNRQFLGRKSRYAYNVHIPYEQTLCFDSLVKYDVEKRSAEKPLFGLGRYGSEAPFAPRVNAQDEGDGYVVTLVTDVNTDTSEVLIIEAKNFSSEPVARVQLPQRVPLGFHALWVPGKKLRAS
jgi:carotenoid cleavage dioxygenase